LRKLAVIYLRGRFLLDTVTVLPFYTLAEGIIDPKYQKLVYLVRTLRLYNGFYLLNYKVFMT